MSARPLPPAYAELVSRVDAFDTRVQAAQGPWLKCGLGCDRCCRQRRTGFSVEIAALRAHLATVDAETSARLQSRRNAPDVVAGRRCVYLDDAGRCDVYPARPLLCRTHGPAIRAEELGLTWCALNFEGLSPDEVSAQVPAEGILNLDLLTRMLVLIDTQYRVGTNLPARQDLEEALNP